MKRGCLQKVVLLICFPALWAVLLSPAIALSADSPCVSGEVACMTNTPAIRNVQFDAINPSGETYARTIGVIFYPTSLGAKNATAPIVIWGGGCYRMGDTLVGTAALSDVFYRVVEVTASGPGDEMTFSANSRWRPEMWPARADAASTVRSSSASSVASCCAAGETPPSRIMPLEI